MNDEHFVERLSAYDEALRRGNSCDTHEGTEDERLAEAMHCVNLLNRIWREPHTDDGEKQELTVVGTRGMPGTENDTDLSPSEATLFTDGEPCDSSPTNLQSIGRFDILRLLGQGGSGIVFLARDRELGRYVALKVPRPQTLLTPELRRRFQLETRAAAALSHPNIVPVYEAGSLGPVCYIASEYCAGPTLAEWLSRSEPVPFQLAAEWMAQLADAMQHAHTRGVLHRDLKPGNILLAQKVSVVNSDLSDDGATAIELAHVVPRITDFGLAKFEASEGAMTRTGALLGTAANMAPEQVEGQTSQVDRRTDVYGLGTILYELMVGQPVFREPTNVATLMAVRHREPVSPSMLRRSVPPDLEAICLTCLEKEAYKRYSTAADLAADLRRFLAGEPTMVRPVGPLRRGLRWVRRNQLLSALIAVIAVSLLGLAAGTFWHSLRIERELVRSERLRSRALDRETQFRELSYAADMRLASEALLKQDVTQATHLLNAHIPAGDEQDYRDAEWHLLNRLAVGKHTLIDDVKSPTYAMACSSDRSRLATVGKDGHLRIYEWPSGKCLSCVPTAQGEGNGVAFAKDSRTVATTGDDGSLKVWDEVTTVQTIKAHEGDALGVAYSEPANAWFTSGADGAIHGWDATTGNAIADFPQNSRSVTALAAARDKHLLASVGRDDTLRVWNLKDTTEINAWKLGSRGMNVAFSSDSEVVATTLFDGHIRRWKVKDWTNLSPIQATHARCVAFSPNGRHVAVGSRVGAIWIWRHSQSHPDSKNDPLLACSWQAHDGEVSSLVFANDRDELISAGEDGKLVHWPAPTERSLDRVYNVDGKLLSVSAFADRPLVATASASEVAIVDVRDGTTVTKLASEEADWCSVWVATKADVVAAARKNGEIWIWTNWQSSPGERHIRRTGAPLSRIRLTPDARYLVAEFDEKAHRPILINLKNGKIQTGFVGISGCSAIAISPDGTRLAIGEHDSNDILIWNIGRHEMLQRHEYHRDTVGALAFSPDSERLAAVDDSARLSLLNCDTGRLEWDAETSPGTLHYWMPSIAFTPAGSSMIVTNALGSTSIWHVETGREMAVLDKYAKNIKSLSFCDGGRFVLGIYQTRLCVIETGMPTGGNKTVSIR